MLSGLADEQGSGVRMRWGRERVAPGAPDGHGGAGVTLAWGCAEEVVALVRATLAS